VTEEEGKTDEDKLMIYERRKTIFGGRIQTFSGQIGRNPVYFGLFHATKSLRARILH
jgi:hypothetical protein